MSHYISEISEKLQNCLYWDDLMIYHHKSGADVGRDLGKPGRIDAYLGILCIKGKIDVECNQKRCLLHEGSMFFSGPHSLLTATMAADAEAYVIAIDSKKLLEYIASSQLALAAFEMMYNSSVIELGEAEKNSILRGINALSACISRPSSAFRSNIIKSCVSAFLFILAEICSAHVNLQAPAVKDSGSDIFLRFMKVLSENYLIHKDVSFYADQLCLSPRYLTTVVRKASSYTVSQWISKFVINDAIYMLKYTELSVKEIAYKLNFPNNSFFCKYFRSHTGMSPMVCRKSYQPLLKESM